MLFLLFFAMSTFCSYNSVASVHLVDDKLVLKAEYNRNGVAFGGYKDWRSHYGQELLNVTSNSGFDAKLQMKAAGMVEGYLTQASIFEVWRNYLYYWGWNSTEQAPTNVTDFMKSNYKWVNSMVEKEKSLFWKHTGLVMEQFEGLVEGYNLKASYDEKLTSLDLYYLNSAGDLYGVLEKFKVEQFLTKHREHKEIPEDLTECSFLLTITEEDDLIFGHNTWRNFGIMNKMYKFYNFPLTSEYDVASKKISFSSSPGLLSSKEDFYLCSSGLAISETTNSIFNEKLYELVTHESLFYWFRVNVANRVGKSGESWVENMKKYFSGTYTNQWIVADYNLWTTREEFPESGLVYLFSEMPGTSNQGDVTDFVKEHGYWPSYNIPYFKDIYEISGYKEMYEKYGDKYSYENAPRAKIFAKLAPKVDSVHEFMNTLEYNKYATDPESEGDPTLSIASRYDLRESLPLPFGGIDGKITNKLLMEDCFAFSYAGPTHWNKDTPPFNWKQFPEVSHYGQPEEYNYGWLLIKKF